MATIRAPTVIVLCTPSSRISGASRAVSAPATRRLLYGAQVSSLGRAVLLWMIPVNLFMVVWVWLGRIVFGVGGWFMLLFLFTVVPVVLIALLLTTILAFTQRGRPRALTPFQAWAQLITWLALLGFGAFMPDFGDTEESQLSLLTQIFGYSDSLFDVSFTIAIAAAAVAIVAYAVLLGSLMFARRNADAAHPG